MTDIVERLRIYATDDHERGCQGRYYDCSCGYDDKRDPLLKEAASEIERLHAALRFAAGYISTYERHANQHPEDVLQWIEDTAQPAAPGGDA